MDRLKINKEITKGIFDKVREEAEKKKAESEGRTEEKQTLILGIESSCDETAAAVVANGRKVLSNVIYSQVPVHTLYGGVVPEIASRAHVEKINQVIRKALSDAGKTI